MTTSSSVNMPIVPTGCAGTGLPLAWQRRCMEVALNPGEAMDLPRPLVQLTEAQVRQIIDDSFTVWEAASPSAGIEVELLETTSECSRAEYNEGGGNMNTIVFVGDWDQRYYVIDDLQIFYDPAAFAVTTAWHDESTGEILDADIEINEQRGPYIQCDKSCTEGGCVDTKDENGRQVVDLQNVLTHEVGHFFGLDHTVVDPSDDDDESLATMWARSPAGEVCKQVLKEDDIEGFRSIYSSATVPSVCDGQPLGGRSFVCGGNEEGCACTTSRAGPGELLWALALVAFVYYRRSATAMPHR